jgi:hypothetical protein
MASRNAGVLRGSRVPEDGQSALASRYHMHWMVDRVCATVETIDSRTITISLGSICKVDGVHVKSLALPSDGEARAPAPSKPSVEAAGEGRRRDADTLRTPTSSMLAS